jgi:hypothetical protein
MQDFNQLDSWKNPTVSIKDPLKQRWAEIVQTMSTHINGVCPMHIYINRRPLESNNPYALKYRVNNFQPLTKDAFDRAISGIVDVCSNADIQVKAPEEIISGTWLIKGKDIYYFCQSDLVRIRETDPNAVIVVLPVINETSQSSVEIIGVDIRLVLSDEIVHMNDYEIKFIGGTIEVKGKHIPYYYYIEDGQYSVIYPNEKGEYETYAIVQLPERKPYIDISSNWVYEGRYKLKMPYLFGAAAWGDKFYGQESDFTVQATRYTYLKEIRAKEKCDQIGCITDPLSGLHIQADNKKPCVKCNGSGYVKDDSPLGTIYVDYSKLNSEERAFPQVISWAEPPQNALTTSKEITDDYFNKMCEALGLIKQNNTNQSAVSKEFDYKEKLSVIYKIFQDNTNVCQEIYRSIEYILLNQEQQPSQVYLVGELGKSDVTDLLVKLSESKTNQSPPSLISAIIDQIYQKLLPPDYSDLIIKIAKKYDKLYIYGSNELTTAKAQFGNSITEKTVIIHNTIIDVLSDYLGNPLNEAREETDLIAYLDTYYSQYNPVIPTATTIGLL